MSDPRSPPEGLSASKLALLARLRDGVKLPPRHIIPAGDSREPAELSFAQQRIWFLDQISPGSNAFNLSHCLEVDTDIDLSALDLAATRLAERHPSLRTTFKMYAGEVRQVAGALPRLAQFDLLDFGSAASAEAARLARLEVEKPFDLENGPPARMAIYRVGACKHVLLFVVHHIIADGWSLGVALRDLGELYMAVCEGREPRLADLPITYGDFAAWQRSTAQEPDPVVESYWRQRLADVPTISLPHDNPRRGARSGRGGQAPLVFAPGLSSSIKRLARQEDVTPFMIMLAALQVMLRRHGAGADIPVGTAVANRGRPEVSDIIGAFVNLIVLRGDVQGNPTFRELLQRVRAACLADLAQQAAPFEAVVRDVLVERDLSSTPLFQVLLVLQNASGPSTFAGHPVRVIPIEVSATQFDLEFYIWDQGEMTGHLKYNSDLFSDDTAQRLVQRLMQLLQTAVESPDTPICELKQLPEDEEALLEGWAGADDPDRAPEPLYRPLHQRFEDQVERTPDAPALSISGQIVTYRKLDELAEGLAGELRAEGVGPEDIVGVCVSRSVGLVSTLLAILKTGAAYLPLDPSYPAERLRFMIEDAGCRALMADSSAPSVIFPGIKVIDPEAAAAAAGTRRPIASASTPPGALAYVIYTSGSTGRPKGVMITHRGASALVEWALRQFPAPTFARTAFTTSICFDLSIFEIFVPLSCGGCVDVLANGLSLLDCQEGAALSLLNTVPSVLAEVAAAGRIPQSARMVCVAGEPLEPGLVDAVFAAASKLEAVINLYGPTEDTTYSTFKQIAADRRERVTIGRPISGGQAYVLDEHSGLAPIGVLGELCLSGSGLARGYLNRPGATGRAFVPHPFSKTPGTRLYRTGDLVRRLPSGELDFVGRVDHQVKLRGYRIELGEVENALLRHPSISEAVVLVGGDDKAGMLVAHLGAAGHTRPADEQLRGELRLQLPEYMLPARFVWFDALPRTSNGKLDRKQLESIAVERPAKRHVAPRTSTERAIAEIWSSALGEARLGLHDDFFALGGHSLLAARIATLVQAEFAVRLPIVMFFKDPTIAAHAAFIDENLRDGDREDRELVEKLLGELSGEEKASLAIELFSIADVGAR